MAELFIETVTTTCPSIDGRVTVASLSGNPADYHGVGSIDIPESILPDPAPNGDKELARRYDDGPWEFCSQAVQDYLLTSCPGWFS